MKGICGRSFGQSYFNGLCQKKKERIITLLNRLMRLNQSQIYKLKGKFCMKVMQEVHDVPMTRHRGENTKKKQLGMLYTNPK